MMNLTLRPSPVGGTPGRGCAPGDGFFRMIAASLILHAALIIFGLFLYRGGPKRIFLTPVSVSLVGPETLSRIGAGVSAGGGVGVGGAGTGPGPAAIATPDASAGGVPAQRPPSGPAVRAARTDAASKARGAPLSSASARTKNPAGGTPARSAPAAGKKDSVCQGCNPFALKKAKGKDIAEDAIKRVKERVEKKEEKEELEAAESHIEALKKKGSFAAKGRSLQGSGRGHQGSGLSGNSETSGGLSAFVKADGLQGAHGAANSGSGGSGNGGGSGGGGGGGGGSGGSGPFVKYRAYLTVVGDRVKANWAYPEEFRKDKTEVIVSIKIGRNGALLESWVEKSSGNSLFDESLMNAVKKAAPYPPLPQDYSDAAFETGLRFCRNCGE